MGIPIRVTGFGVLGVSLEVEYVETNREVVRRVLTRFEDMRVLFEPPHREDYEFCRLSAVKMRDLLSLEIPNVKHGGSLEASFKRIRTAARTFVTAAGPRSATFAGDPDHFYACLHALREQVGEEIVALAAEFKIDLENHLLAVLPGQDLSFIPGFGTTRSADTAT